MENPDTDDMQTQNPSSCSVSHEDHLQNPTNFTHADTIELQKMEKFKKKILKLVNNGGDNHMLKLSPSQFDLLQQRLTQVFPLFNIPTHPTYGAMIQAAVVNLGEIGTLCSEESISEYIKNNYGGLPWAHKRFLTHHLQKLCECGELVSVRGEYYEFPGKDEKCDLRRSKRKLQKGRDNKGVVEVGSAGEEDVLEYHDEVGFREEEIQSGKNSTKRKRRRSLILDEEGEEEEEEGGILDRGVIIKEGNLISGREIVPVAEERNEVLELASSRVDDKVNEPEQLHTGKVAEDHEPVNIGGDGPLAEQPAYDVEGKLGPQLDALNLRACEDESEKKELPANDDPHEGEIDENDENLANYPSESGGERKTSQVDDSGGKLMLVAIDNEREPGFEGDHHCNSSADLLLKPIVVDPLASSAPDIKCVTPRGKVITSILTERHHDCSSNKLMIVPFVGLTLDDTARLKINGESLSQKVNPVTVCGLPSLKLEDRKQNKKLSRQKKGPKATKRKPVPLVEEPLLAFSASVGLKLQPCVPSRHGKPETKGVPDVLCEEASLSSDCGDEQLKNRRSSHSSCPGVCEVPIAISDEGNLPLKQVFEHCGKRKRPAMAVTTMGSSQESVLPSRSGSQLPGGQPNSESPVKMTPKGEVELTQTKETEEQWQQKQPQFTSQDRNQYTLEHIQVVQNKVADQQSSAHVTLLEETLPSYDKSCEGQVSRENKGDCAPVADTEQSTKNSVCELSLTQHLCQSEVEQNHQNVSALEEMVSCDTQLATIDLRIPVASDNMQSRSGGISGDQSERKLRGRPSKTSSTPNHSLEEMPLSGHHSRTLHEGDKNQCHISHLNTETVAASTGESKVPPLEKNPTLEEPSDLHFQEQEPTETATDQQLKQQNEPVQRRVRRPRINDDSPQNAEDPSNLLLQEKEECESAADHHLGQHGERLIGRKRGRPKKMERRSEIGRQPESPIEEASWPSKSGHLRQAALSDAAAHEHSQHQYKQQIVKKRGRPRSLNYGDQLAAHEPSQHQDRQQIVKKRGRPRKQSYGDQLAAHEPSQHQDRQENVKKRGRPRLQSNQLIEQQEKKHQLRQSSRISDVAAASSDSQTEKLPDEIPNDEATPVPSNHESHQQEKELKENPCPEAEVSDNKVQCISADPKQATEEVSPGPMKPVHQLDVGPSESSTGVHFCQEVEQQKKKKRGRAHNQQKVDQLSQRQEQKQPPRRSSRIFDVAALKDSQTDELHDRKSSDRRQPHSSTPTPVPSEHEFDWQETDRKKYYSTDTRSQETLSDSQRHQEQAEVHSQNQKEAKFQEQAKPHKEKSAKSSGIRVPLSSKDQLRSRIKCQSQDSA